MRILKNITPFLLIISLMIAAIIAPYSPIYATSNIRLYIDSKEVYFPDAKPFIDSAGRTQVPIRFISENLGATVSWDGVNEIVKIVKGDDTLSMKINGKTMTKNGKLITMDTAPVLVNNRTMVPIRFVSENLGVAVEWDAKNFAVIIKTGLIPGNIIEVVDPDHEHIADLARDNASIGTLYEIDPDQTYEYVTDLEAFADDTDSDLQTMMYTGTGVYDGSTVSVGTNEQGYDLVIYQMNGKSESFNATWVALTTIFGTTDATKVYMQMYGMYTARVDGTMTEAGMRTYGSITGWDYIIQGVSPIGFHLYFTKQ